MKLKLTKLLIPITVVITSRIVCTTIPKMPKTNLPDVTKHENLNLLPHDVCGPVHTDDRIFNGNRIGMFDFPWMALLVYLIKEKYYKSSCGGSLINEFYILTAAHCVTELENDTKLFGVRVGEYDLTTNPDCENDENNLTWFCAPKSQDFFIRTVHYHPKFSKSRLQNDIGLIRLDRKIVFNEFTVQPICLPIGPESYLRQKKVIVTGWGKTETNPRSKELLRVSLSPLTIENCEQFYKKTRVEILSESHLCAYGGKLDACTGDSGGPLQALGFYLTNKTRYVKYRYIQYGIVSFGLFQKCGIAGVPGVYTRIDNYVNWILDTIKA